MAAAATTFGVHSEVGQLRKVLVCSPGLAHSRLTPSNADRLLFDDVLWVDNAKRDHFDFVSKMRDRGIDVVEMQYLLPPLPNTIYTRDTTCWIYGGVTLNNLYWPARHEETILAAAIYKFHPDFAGKVNVWWGDPLVDHGLATLEGGDVMPIGKGIVLIGLSERTSRQAISQV